MEGPSLFLASEQLTVFKGKKVKVVSGNTKIGKERLLGKKVMDVFSWGKHLVFQFDDFAIRTHFMLFGTYEATIDGTTMTGDYKRAYVPRLELQFENGDIKMFNCSIKFIESPNARETYDFSIDIMSPKWDPKKALSNVLQYPEEDIADVLLDQSIFSGVGNIIKNEVLSIVKINPKRKVKDLPEEKLKEIIETTHSFSWQFYKWRKKFVLIKHLKIHRKGSCPYCGGKVSHEVSGKRKRISHYCPVCQRY
jgi:endonuclease-8